LVPTAKVKLRQNYLFPAVVFMTSAALTYILYPHYLLQIPFMLFFAALAVNTAKCGFFTGLLTGLGAASFMRAVTFNRPYEVSWTTIGLFFVAAYIIAHHLGKRFSIEQSLRLQIEEKNRIQVDLKSQEENLRLALSSERSGIWEWDVLTNEVTWSSELERMHGIPVGSFEGTFEAAMRDIHSADRKRVLDTIEESLKSKGTFDIEYRFIKPNKEMGWLEGHGSFRLNDKGEPIRLVGLCTEVTQHKLAEEVHSRLSAIVASSADAIISESLDGRIITWNTGAERIFGYSAAEAIGQYISLLTPPDRINEPSYMLDQVRSGQALNLAETQRLHKNGHTLYVSVSISPVRNAQGEIIGVSKIARDITTRKRAQLRERYLMEASDVLGSSLEYEQSLKKLASLTVPAIADWCTIFILSEDGSLRRVAMANQDENEVKRAEEFDKLYPEDPKTPNGLYHVIRTGEAEIFNSANEGTLGLFSRDEVHLRYLQSLNIRSGILVPLHAHGKTFGAIILVSTRSDREFGSQDLLFTQELGRRAGLAIENARLYHEAQKAVARYEEELVERTRIEKELRRAKEIADQSSRAKTEFLANMSHEIRTPLGAILGFSELLVTTEQSQADRQESLEVITRNGNLLSNIINDILDLTRVESGRLEIERIPVPLVPLFEETRSSLSLLASEKGIGLHLKFADGLSDSLITDPLRLKQILINVIGNAIKFTSSGRVDVSVRWQAREQATDLLQVEVKDTGKGLADDEVLKLFHPFSQADASTTRKFGGTGLGLILSRQLARALGGDVRLLESRPQKGSTFGITLDAGIVHQDASIQHRSVPNSVAAPSSSAARALEGMTILVVEDARDNQLLMSRILRLDGAHFEIAENGAIGVERAAGSRFDVILMDVQMPVMDGIEAMLELRRRGYAKPIIALTAHAMREDRDRCLALGFDDYMTKPVDRKKLKSLLVRYQVGEGKSDVWPPNALVTC
jgi:PAS domain S-box-containing protein